MTTLWQIVFHVGWVPTNKTADKERALVVLRDSQIPSKDQQTPLNAKVSVRFILPKVR